jgi:hypothetical protein
MTKIMAESIKKSHEAEAMPIPINVTYIPRDRGCLV